MDPEDDDRHEATFFIPADHPAVPGHFPGNPLVPAVLLLEQVIEAAERWLGGTLQVRGLPQAKFVTPLRPGEEARVALELCGDALDFSIRRNDATIAKGRLVLERAAGP